jgi:hypothetical protein
MNWDLEGLCVNGTYMDEFQVHGRVTLSRVKFGGEVSHHVTLIKPMMIYGNMRDRVILNHKDVTQVFSTLNELI